MITGKQKALAKLLAASGVAKLASSFGPRRLTVFNFHRIRERGSKQFEITDFDDEVFGPDAEEFRTHMRWLKSNSEPISEDDLLSSLRTSRPLPARATLVTFDDGYIDNFTLALPILKETGVPAIFFVPTQAIGERTLGWWDLIAYSLKRTDLEEISVEGERFSLRNHEEIEIARTRFQQAMKLMPATESQALVERLTIACDVPVPGPELGDRELMSWEQVRAAAAAGIAIGSHTHTHRVLATLDLASQREELSRSKTELETKLGRPVRTLSYPVGGYEHFNPETKLLARECGYEAAFSFHTGVNRADRLDAYDIRRVSAPDNPVLYQGTLAVPLLYGRRRCTAAAPVPALS